MIMIFKKNLHTLFITTKTHFNDIQLKDSKNLATAHENNLIANL